MNINFLQKKKIDLKEKISFLDIFKYSKSKTVTRSRIKFGTDLRSKSGFTLVEMLVSIAIFSLVLVVVIGSILVVIDANRKARTLSSVMNNMNFALESMTRTISTGYFVSITDGGSSITVENQYGDIVTYSLQLDPPDTGTGRIIRIMDGQSVPVTAREVEIESLEFEVTNTEPYRQPRVSIIINGVSRIGQKISSDFILQATVSQRNLNLGF